MKQFRLLRADEIECRIGMVKPSGVSLLLYKNARTDMDILDETVGAENWQRSHSRDNANCAVSIWDGDKKQWIVKEDVGVESNTEADKGKASDSFKRACVNWGIGRELYTAPFIWVPSDKCNIEGTGRKDKYGNQTLTCRDKFRVKLIEYDDKRRIKALTIENVRFNIVVFQSGRSGLQNTKSGVKNNAKIVEKTHPVATVQPVPTLSAEEQKTVEELIIRTGETIDEFCGRFGIASLGQLSRAKYQYMMNVYSRPTVNQ